MRASLDAINDQNSGLTDTDVREILARAVIERLVEKNVTLIPDREDAMKRDGLRGNDFFMHAASTSQGGAEVLRLTGRFTIQ